VAARQVWVRPVAVSLFSGGVRPARRRRSLPPGLSRSAAAGPPEPVVLDCGPYDVDTAGTWLVVSDMHLPYHDRVALELAVREAVRRRVVGVLLNGDVLDSHELSDHEKDPRAARYVAEVEAGRRLLVWLRSSLPRARLIYKEGNHEERLTRYVFNRAPALFGLEAVTLPELLGCVGLGVEWVSDRRVVRLGNLNVIHGHEYRGGVSAPVNPARGVYLKARSVVLCGHWHRTSEHHERNIRGKSEAAWSVGCVCQLSPRYAPLNNWNLGFAFVRVGRDGGFEVDNRRVLSGKVV